MRLRFWCAIPVLGLAVTSCSTGPRPPQPGTPAFYWAAARETWRTGDYLKTNDNLELIAKTDNEFGARARVWQMVVASGLAKSYAELAATYAAGARANRRNPAPFRRQEALYNNAASTAALQFAESFHRFRAAPGGAAVALEFRYPSGNSGQPPELRRVAAMIQRGVLLSACRVTGAADDPARALELFRQGSAQADVHVFLMAVAEMLHEQAELFGPKKLDQPNRVKLFCGEAMEALKMVPPGKPSKDLAIKVQSTLKKSKIT
jgi:hypothetical protein